MEKEGETETIFSISSIMMKLPSKNLGNIRARFQKQPDGLNLYDFITTIMENMGPHPHAESIRIVADLIDFFHFIDVNGDALLSWEEFVSFIVEQVVHHTDTPDQESLTEVGSFPIQAAADRKTVQCVMTIHDLGKVFIGIGEVIQVYSIDDKLPSWTKLIAEIPLQARVSIIPTKKLAEGDPVDIIDMTYSKAQDILCILRSDVCLEFFHISSRSKISRETICAAGIHPLDESYDRIVARNIRNEQGMLLAAGKSKHIATWKLSLSLMSQVTAEEHHPLRKHTDFIRDMIDINTEEHYLLATCAMDRKLFIWDLETMAYRSSRSGHKAGVQCLAYDGVSMLLAGGFDHSILGWDINDEIDKPRFKLDGHKGTILKVIGIGISHVCLSLDELGELRYWRTSTAEKDHNDRLIDVISCNDDHLRSFDVVCNLSPSFKALYDLMIIGAGRRQHVYKISDTTPSLGPPVAAHYSSTLQTIIVSHARDLNFWSANTGQGMKTMRNVVHGGEICVSALDARGRKLIIAEQMGVVSIFNPLDGSCLHRFKQLPSSIKFVFYSPDKCILALSSLGDIFVMNEWEESDLFLRHVAVPETDIVACAYSYKLGLIATMDNAGMLIIWDYQFLTIELVVENCLGTATALGAILFLEKYPLLIASDNIGNFTIVILGNAALNRKDIVWRVSATCDPDPYSNSCETAEGADFSLSPNIKGGEILSDKFKFPNKTLKKCISSLTEDGYSIDGGMRSEDTVQQELQSGDRHSEDNEDGDDTNTEDLLGPREGRAKPFDKKKIRKYLKIPRIIQCMTAHIEDSSEDGNDSIVESTSIRASTNLAGYIRRNTSTVKLDVEGSSASSVGPMEFPPTVIVSLLCGYDDGSMASYDLTDALSKINVGPLRPSEIIPLQTGYNGHRKLQKHISESELARHIAKRRHLVQKKKTASCSVNCVWAPHSGAINSLSIVGEYDSLLSSSVDGTVQLWSLRGHFLGILTRGGEYDRVFHRHWSSPVDELERENNRLTVATHMYKATMRRGSAIFKNHLLPVKQSQRTVLSDVKSVTSEEIHPIRDRAIGQLHGKITYIPSTQEIAEMTVAKKGEKVIQAIRDIGKPKRRKRKKKKIDGPVGMLTDLDYYESIDYTPSAIVQTEIHSLRDTSRFQREIANMLAAAPDNWGLNSVNTQRKLYQNMYIEKAKSGLDTNRVKIMKAKLDSLSPGNNFDEYIHELESGRGMDRFRSTAMFDAAVSFYDFHPEGGMTRTSMSSSNPLLPLPLDEMNKNGIAMDGQGEDEEEEGNDANNKERKHAMLAKDNEDDTDDDAASVKKKNTEGSIVHRHRKKTTDMISFRVHEAREEEEELEKEEENRRRRRSSSISNGGNGSRGVGVTVTEGKTIRPMFNQHHDVDDNDNDNDNVDDDVVPSPPPSLSLSLSLPLYAANEINPIIRNKESQSNHSRSHTMSVPVTVSSSLSVAGPVSTAIRGNVVAVSRRESFHRRISLKGQNEMMNEIIEKSSVDLVNRQQLLHQNSNKYDHGNTNYNNNNSKKNDNNSKTEMRWVQKVKYTLNQVQKVHNHNHGNSLVIPEVKRKKPSAAVLETRPSSRTLSTERSHRYPENEMIIRTTFGPYRASDMLKAMNVFLSLHPFDPDHNIHNIKGYTSTTMKKDEKEEKIVSFHSIDNPRKVLLVDFISNEFVQFRPHFEQELRKSIKKKTSKFGTGEIISSSLPEIISSMCPLMNTHDLSDCIDYLDLQRKLQSTNAIKTDDNILTNEQTQHLQRIFDFFDKDKKGYINKDVIMHLMETESTKFYAKQQAAFLEGGELEEEIRIEEASLAKMLSSVKLKRYNELDFEEFVSLFKNVI